MAGVGRIGDFGKPDYETNVDVEDRLDTTDPFSDERIPYEDRIKALMDRGMSREQAVEWIKHTSEDARNREYTKREILVEQTQFRKELGDLKNCTPIDESCLLPGPEGEERKSPQARKRQGPLPER